MNFDNEWYVVCESREVGRDGPSRISLYGQGIVLWRTQEGALHAMSDRCPHLGASLSLGKVIDNQLVCPMHAFRYDASGVCTRIPQRNDPTRVPQGLCVPTLATRERDGWIFVFWGEPSLITEEPEYLTEVEDPRLTSTTSVHQWKTHFSRVIENQLDSAHVKHVHASSIGRFIPEAVDKQLQVSGRVLKARNAANGHEKQYTKLLYPNIWVNFVNEKLVMMIVVVPVTPDESKIYLRTYQGFIKAPLLGAMMAKTMHLLSKKVLGEDEPIATSQEPKDSLQAEERLQEFDNMIAAYRKLRRDRVRDAGRRTPIRSYLTELRPIRKNDENAAG